MPTTYTHCRFGRQVLPQLPDEVQKRIKAHPELYMIGLHGPDIFFYYNPFTKNPVGTVGSTMHTWTGEKAFRQLFRLYDGSDEAFSYLMGFLCHFALDSACHGYINEMVETAGVGHNLQEIELDRSFLLEDCLDPLTHDPVGHIHPTRQNARVIASFFPQLTENQIYETLLRMKLYLRLLLPGSKPKRAVLRGAIGALHAQGSFGELVLKPQPDPRCLPMVVHLRKLYRQSIPLAVRLITNFPTLEDAQYQLSFNGT